MKKSILVLISIVFCLSVFIKPSLAEDDPFITLGSADLKLGMAKEDVVEYLKKSGLHITAKNSSNAQIRENIFVVSSKVPPQDDYDLLGQIVFKNNRLVYISKDWTPSVEKSAFSFVKALYAALSNTMRSDESSAAIFKSIYIQPKFNSRNIILFVGPFEIAIYCTDYEDYPDSASINQILRDYQQFP